MTDHLSHPDMLMARALGVCWHSPTSDRWPCQQPLADWEIQLLRSRCGACGCAEMEHGATEGDTGCRLKDCDCDAFEGPEAPHEEEFTAAELIHTARTMDAAGVPADAGEEAVRAVAAFLRSCDRDPIECNHEAALGEAEEKLRRVEGLLEFYESNDPEFRERHMRYFRRALGGAE